MKIIDAICDGRQIKGEFISALARIEPDQGYKLEIKTVNHRTLEQNRKMWAMLNDISRQVVWHGQRLKTEEWKHIFSASIKGQRIVPGLDGELVVLGASTSNETVKFLGEMIELMYSFGAEQFVMWSDPAEKALMQYPEAMRA